MRATRAALAAPVLAIVAASVAAVVSAIVAAVVVLATPGVATAHSALLGTTPGDGQVVTATTTEVTLTFNEPVRASFSTVAVTGPDARGYSAGDLSVLDNVVRQPVYPLGSGAYQVAWRVVSADGHPVSGTFSFTVELPPGQEPSATPPPSPVAAPPDGSGWSRWWWAPVAVAVAALVLLLLRAGRARRP